MRQRLPVTVDTGGDRFEVDVARWVGLCAGIVVFSQKSKHMRQVGSRKEGQVAVEASGQLLAQGARFNESVSWLSGAAFVPKGVYRYRSHEEANRHAQDCLVRGMAALAARRR